MVSMRNRVGMKPLFDGVIMTRFFRVRYFWKLSKTIELSREWKYGKKDFRLC